MEYTELDRATQINMIKNRLRDLEQQHLTVSMRVSAPDINTPPTEADGQILTRLEDGIGKLREMLVPLEGPAASAQSQ